MAEHDKQPIYPPQPAYAGAPPGYGNQTYGSPVHQVIVSHQPAVDVS